MSKYIIRMHDLYGIDGIVAYYRPLGDCFNFANDRKYATPVTEEEKDKVLSHSDFYCKQFGAKYMDCVSVQEGGDKE